MNFILHAFWFFESIFHLFSFCTIFLFFSGTATKDFFTINNRKLNFGFRLQAQIHYLADHSRIQIDFRKSEKHKTLCNQTTYGGGLKCNSNHISTETPQSGCSGHLTYNNNVKSRVTVVRQSSRAESILLLAEQWRTIQRTSVCGQPGWIKLSALQLFGGRDDGFPFFVFPCWLTPTSSPQQPIHIGRCMGTK